MGVVYEARQESLDRRVALKTLHPEHARNKETVTRFFNEAKVLSKLEHPSIVQVSDFGTAPDGTVYLVMEYLRGESFRHRLESYTQRGDRLPILAALQIAWQIADVLAVAHAMGIVHRDLKPENLMLVADSVAPSGERVKLLDFGIAKLTKERDRGGLKTDTQAVIGTPAYMSPEQCAGAGGVDAKSDVYSLGCVLYEAISGRPPFEADGAGRIIAMHLFQEPPPLASLAPKTPSAVIELTHRFLTKEKRQRPSMSEAADDLGRLLSKLSGAGPVVRSKLPNSTDPDSTRVIRGAGQSTTLGNSIGQHSGGGNRKRMVLFIGAMAVLAVGGVGLWRGLPSVPTKQAEASGNTKAMGGAAKTPTPPTTVHWSITSEPSGAVVLNGEGTMLGTTPFRAEQTPKDGQSVLRVRRDGYVEFELTLEQNADAEQHIRLVKISNPKATTAKPRANAPVPQVPQFKPRPPNSAGATQKTETNKGLSYED